MPSLPSNVLFSTVTGRFLHAKIDGSDSDRQPDGDPWVNLSVRFTASVASRKNKVSDPPTWITLDPIDARTDLNGDLVTPADGRPGVLLIATDNPDLGDGEDWLWRVEITGVGFPGLSFNFLAPANKIVDLTKIAPIPDNYVQVLPEWQTTLTKVQDLIDAIPDPGPQLTPEQIDAVVGISSGRLGPTSKNISGLNANFLTENGFYAGSNLINSPDGTDGWWYILVQQNRDADNYFMQTATKYARGSASGDTFRRFSEGGTFTPWTRTGDSGGASDGILRTILGATERISPRGKDITATDLNSTVDSGFYTGKTLGNAPLSLTGYFFVFVKGYSADTNWVEQTVTEFADVNGNASSGRRAWTRQRQGGAWTGWTQLADNTGAIDTGARATAAAAATKSYVDSTFALVGRAVAAGSGLTGGGTLVSDRTISLSSGSIASLQKADSAVQPAALATKADLVNGVIPSSQIPAMALVSRTTVANQAARLALTSAQIQPGDVAVQQDTGGVYLLVDTDPSVNSNWIIINSPAGGVSSVNNQTGAVTLGKADVGLGNADNTSDVNKPVSTAQQTALNLKLDASIAGNSSVYAKSSGGVPNSLSYTSAATGSTLLQRKSDGNVTLPTTPSASTDAAPKQYVDDRAGDKNPITANTTATGTVALANASAGACTYRLTVTGALTLTLPTPTDTLNGWTVVLRLTQNATGGYAVTLPTNVKWDSGTKPTLSTAANAIDYVTFLWDGVNWVGFLGAKAAA